MIASQSPAPIQFVHLRCHSEFSVVDGIVRIGDLVKKAAADNMPAVALTDVSNLFGMVKFYRAARGKGVKPIVGADVWITNEADRDKPFRGLLLVKNKSGYLQLCALLSRAFLENTWRDRAEIKFSWFEEMGCKGLIALSGAQHGEVGMALAAGNQAGAKAAAERWAAQFRASFYLEIQRYGQAGAEVAVHDTVALATQLHLPVVATHPIQFLQPEDYRAHEARVCIADGEILSNPRRNKRFTADQYVKTQAEMATLFADVPSALQNTVEIAKRCNLTLELGKPKLPLFPTPDGMSLDDYLRHLSNEGLQKRLLQLYPNPADREAKREEYESRLKLECDTIIQMGFPGYFLIVQDFINWAKRNGVPVGPGRGSGAGSLVAFSLGITDLDPLPYDLLFERFLNPERVSMPDFDIDFCQDGRDRVIDYVKEAYGRDAVSQIATFGTLGAKAVIRDCGRVLDLPYGYCDSLSKLIPHSPTDPWDLERALKDEPQFKERFDTEDEAREIVELARPLEGLTRNIGMHAGGVLIAPGKLTDFCPLYCAPGTDSVVSQYDKDDVEAVGLVKFDFLGLRNLTIVDWAVRYIHRLGSQPTDWTLDALNGFDDPAAYRLLSDGNTTAVFQLESRGMKELLKKLKPSVFEDIIAVLALYRPGPLGSGMVDDFILRKHGKAEADYFHPALEPVLKPTYGVIVYQEQVMLISQVIGGYTLGGADLLRRAMGKKKPEEMAKHRGIFTEGAQKGGFDTNLATKLFDLMEKFAEYGFNKSHTAAYAVVAYQTAWLKAHHPAEFMAATLSSDMDDTDKVKIFVEDALTSCDLTVLPPDVNASEYRFVPVDARTIRYGLGAIKGTGENAVNAIIAAREEKPFTDLFDFCIRVDKRQVNRRTIEALIRGGAFDTLNDDRATLLATVERAMAAAEQAERSAGQGGLFDGGGEDDGPSHNGHEYVRAPRFSEREKLQQEKTALGFYLSGHLFSAYAPEVRRFARAKLADIRPARDPQTLAGIVVTVRTQMGKRGKMAFALLDDGSDQLEVSIFADAYDKYRAYLREDELVVIQGKVSEDTYSGGMRVVVDKVMDVAAARANYARGLLLELDAAGKVPTTPAQLKSWLQPHCAALTNNAEEGCPVLVRFHNGQALCELQLGPAWRIRPHDDLLLHLRSKLGDNAVQLKY
ncbi:DNA polymerase III subunit alpha [Parvibium lacunae]|uniref:DNA polymerase III subunit alpha n=1 Tax=Parvibium lacunae TaxID=1888893 RepID=A0A368L4I1_9BURK|nr:DNA polymerase III subunit alpha [Parvibium lacunae]RCS58425.1 DNA polymerase III subunit alpha [Parvibium lacunae]